MKGERGDQGIPGETGLKGFRGPIGDPGVDGPRGKFLLNHDTVYIDHY